jgi:hypothetical protein
MAQSHIYNKPAKRPAAIKLFTDKVLEIANNSIEIKWLMY